MLINVEQQQLNQKQFFLLLLLALTLWAFMHPYEGLSHDSRLYMVDALRILNPDNFQQELYFDDTSQGNYTLFPLLLAHSVDVLGIDHSAIIFTFIGQSLLLSGALFLGITFFNRNLAIVFFCLFISVKGYDIVVANLFELFATGRSWAMGLSLFAIGFWLRKIYWLAAVLGFAAIAIHPLLGITAFVVLFFTFSLRRIFILSLAGLTLLLLLNWTEAPIVSRLWQTMDTEWLDIVEPRSSFLFLKHWHTSEWNIFIFQFSIILIALRQYDGPHKIWLLASLVATTFVLLTSWLLGDHFHNLLVIQVQPWRILWLFHIFSLLSISYILFGHTLSAWQKQLLLALASCYLLTPVFGAKPAIAIAIAWLTPFTPSGNVKRFLGAAISSIFALGLLFHIISMRYAVDIATARGGENTWDMIYHFLDLRPEIAVLLLLVISHVIQQHTQTALKTTLLAISLFSGAALSMFRSDYERQPDIDPESLARIQEFITTDKLVYWEHGVSKTWFSLQRSHYMSTLQGAGLAFSRDIAIEAWRRVEILRSAGMTDGLFVLPGYGTPPEIPTASNESIAHLCVDPLLDFVITGRRLDIAPSLIFKENVFDNYLYSCTVVRASD